MDLLGMEGQKAAEGLEAVAERLNNLESHLNAVDNAVQDMGNQMQSLEQKSVTQQELTQMLQSPEDGEDVDIEQLRTFFLQLSKSQKENRKRLEDIEDLESDFVGTLQRMQKTVKKAHLRNNKLESRIKRLENKFSDVEMKVEQHDKQLEETEEIKEELEQVERQNQENMQGKAFEEKQQDVEDELKNLRSSIKQFADRVE